MRSDTMIRRDFLKTIALLTGSVAFGVSTEKSDEDWLISESDFEQLDLPENELDDGSGDGNFVSVRFENFNFIVWKNEEFRDNWIKAHNYCMKERPSKKERRIEIFRYFLYGEQRFEYGPVPDKDSQPQK